MNTYRVIPASVDHWTIERTCDDRAPHILPITFGDASEAAFVVFKMTREELRRAGSGTAQRPAF
jgi:hypothetical protein